jgi:NADPH-dependent 2,4-dienoyl-CoA reductase/sulfur reductase-like enzyme
MPAEPGYVIIGASLAGAKAAETLREEGFSGAVTLIGAENERPYERPPLSKGYLLGRDAKDSMFVHEEGWYREHDVDLRLGTTVTSIDRAARRVGLAGGESVPYERLLITMGASPRRLNTPGGPLVTVSACATPCAAVARSSSPGRAGSAWRPLRPRVSTAATSRSSSRPAACCSARLAQRWVSTLPTCIAATG